MIKTMQDVLLRCCECGQNFLYTAGEQLYFESKSLSPPKRCPSCRKKRKSNLVPDMKYLHTCVNCYYRLANGLCRCREVTDMVTSGFCDDWIEGHLNDNQNIE